MLRNLGVLIAAFTVLGKSSECSWHMEKFYSLFFCIDIAWKSELFEIVSERDLHLAVA
jgi:hypothetical protein